MAKQFTGLYDELEDEAVVPNRSGVGQVLFLAAACARFFLPIIALPFGAFLLFTRAFEIPWGWAVVPTFFVGTFLLSLSSMSAPIFVASLPPLIRFRMNATYYLFVGSIAFILVVSSLAIRWSQRYSIVATLPWFLICLLSLLLPLVVCCILGGAFVAPKIATLQRQGGRHRTYQEADGTIVHARE